MGINQSLTEALKSIIEIFHENNIGYALAGGLAFSALVEPRATMDIDLLIMVDEMALIEFFDLLKKKYRSLIIHREPMVFNRIKIWRAVEIKKDHEIIFDFLLAQSEFHKNVLARAVTLEFNGSPLKIITMEDLILLKKCADRPQDRIDISRIYALYKTKLDNEYIEKWIGKLNIP